MKNTLHLIALTALLGSVSVLAEAPAPIVKPGAVNPGSVRATPALRPGAPTAAGVLNRKEVNGANTQTGIRFNANREEQPAQIETSEVNTQAGSNRDSIPERGESNEVDFNSPRRTEDRNAGGPDSASDPLVQQYMAGLSPTEQTTLKNTLTEVSGNPAAQEGLVLFVNALSTANGDTGQAIQNIVELTNNNNLPVATQTDVLKTACYCVPNASACAIATQLSAQLPNLLTTAAGSAAAITGLSFNYDDAKNITGINMQLTHTTDPTQKLDPVTVAIDPAKTAKGYALDPVDPKGSESEEQVG